jgi:hypothetical protein
MVEEPSCHRAFQVRVMHKECCKPCSRKPPLPSQPPTYKTQAKGEKDAINNSKIRCRSGNSGPVRQLFTLQSPKFDLQELWQLLPTRSRLHAFTASSINPVYIARPIHYHLRQPNSGVPYVTRTTSDSLIRPNEELKSDW